MALAFIPGNVWGNARLYNALAAIVSKLPGLIPDNRAILISIRAHSIYQAYNDVKKLGFQSWDEPKER